MPPQSKNDRPAPGKNGQPGHNPGAGDNDFDKAAGGRRRNKQMRRFLFELVRPYRTWLVIVFIAMLAEITMSLAAPWPLKLVLDDALVNHKLPDWLAWAHSYGIGRHAVGVALFAGLATLFIAVIAAVATYVDN